MNPQIITVDDIQKSIKDIGVRPFANSLVQEIGGDYFYVEAEIVTEPTPEHKMTSNEMFYGYNREVDTSVLYKYRVWPVPLRLAWFVIDALKLKGQIVNVGNQEYDESRQRVYLPAGVEIFGKKVERLTEIPAEMRPVVVERL